MRKINIEDFNKILADAKKMGYNLRMSDIFYTFGLQRFDSPKIVYSVLFGKGSSQEDVDYYDESSKIKFLKKYINANYPSDDAGQPKRGKPKKSGESHEDITFEENKAYMLKLKKETEEAIKKGEIEKKDGLKILADLSVKLNDKFAVSEKQDEQRIIVYKKYNDICVCGREIYRPTKNDIIEELKEEYDLVPKKKDKGDE